MRTMSLPSARPPRRSPARRPPHVTPPRGSAVAGRRRGRACRRRRLARIAGLALPALVVLAAEPLYVLVDTAVVGHLGRVPLAARRRRRHRACRWRPGSARSWRTGPPAGPPAGSGPGTGAAAVAEGVQASWLALAFGVLLAVARPSRRRTAGPSPRRRSRRGRCGRGMAADRRARRAGAAARRRGQRLDARGAGHPAAADLRARAPTCCRRCSVRCSSIPLGWGLIGSAVANVVAQSVSGWLFLVALVRETRALRPASAAHRCSSSRSGGTC